MQQDISFLTFEGLTGKFKGLRPAVEKTKNKVAARGNGYQGKGGPNAYQPPKRKKPEKAFKDRSDRLEPGLGLGSNDGMAPLKRKKPTDDSQGEA